MKKAMIYAIIWFFVFVFGVGVGASGETKETKTEPTRIVSDGRFEKLKEVDDEIFAVFQKQNNLCVQAVNAAIVGDAKTINRVADEVRKHAKEIERLGEKRAAIVENK